MKVIILSEGDSPLPTLQKCGQPLGAKSSPQLTVNVDFSSTTKRT